MKEQINLESIEPNNVTDSERAVFRVFNNALRDPASSQARAAAIANELRRLFDSADTIENLGVLCWDLWMGLLDIVFLVPPDHPWQDTLVEALEVLRQQGGPMGNVEANKSSWADLPDLSSYMLDKWDDVTEYDDISADILLKWKNLNSFAARLTSAEYAPSLSFPIWALRSALEEPPKTGTAADCRLWVATEWILRSGDVIFDYMNSSEQLTDNMATSLAAGSLCEGIEDITPLSMQRWSFWKKRLQEIAEDSQNIGLEGASVDRIKTTLEKMDKIEGGSR